MPGANWCCKRIVEKPKAPSWGSAFPCRPWEHRASARRSLPPLGAPSPSSAVPHSAFAGPISTKSARRPPEAVAGYTTGEDLAGRPSTRLQQLAQNGFRVAADDRCAAYGRRQAIARSRKRIRPRSRGLVCCDGGLSIRHRRWSRSPCRGTRRPAVRSGLRRSPSGRAAHSTAGPDGRLRRRWRGWCR